MALFGLGINSTVATPGALDLLQRTATSALTLLRRHVNGDWGDVCEDDAHINAQAVKDGSRILSCYRLGESDDDRLWIITEAEIAPGRRYATTLLLPSEY